MNSSVVREKFFEFFKDKQHEIIPSASVINETDKHLMFTNAGIFLQEIRIQNFLELQTLKNV